MRRLQMGMWNGFSMEEWESYRLARLNGFEISRYASQIELIEMQKFCSDRQITFGIHVPALEQTTPPYPLFTALDKEVRQEALRLAEAEVGNAARLGADYILFHYPFPPIFPSRKNEAYLKGGPDHIYLESGEVEGEALREWGHFVFRTLGELQKRYKQRIVLEYDFFGDFEDEFVELFETYPDLMLVIDTQRLDIHARMFPDFDPYRWLDRIAPYVYLVHYSDVEYDKDGVVARHLPVLPERVCDPAFGDAYAYLRFLAERNERFHVTFEHNPRAVTIEELKRVYDAVGDIMGLDTIHV